MKVRFKLWRMTAEEWAAQNPLLLEDEPGIESDTGKWKFGTGYDNWNDLQYEAGQAPDLEVPDLSLLFENGLV